MRDCRKENYEIIEELCEKHKTDMIILGGDLNARTANKGGWIDAERVERRISKDKKINKEAKELI